MAEPIFVEEEPGIAFGHDWVRIKHLESTEIWPPAVFLAFCQRGILAFGEWEAKHCAAVRIRKPV